MMTGLIVIFILGMATMFYSENRKKIDKMSDKFEKTFKD